jgi:hypothetical protein
MGLHSTVYLEVDGQPVSYGPGDKIPEAHARRIGAHAFEDGKHPFPGAADADGDGDPDRESGQEPKRSGKGSGRDNWVAFATEVGHGDLVEGKSRDEIIAALEDAGAIQPLDPQ